MTREHNVRQTKSFLVFFLTELHQGFTDSKIQGNSFPSFGPITEKALSPPYFVDVRGTIKLDWWPNLLDLDNVRIIKSSD